MRFASIRLVSMFWSCVTFRIVSKSVVSCACRFHPIRFPFLDSIREHPVFQVALSRFKLHDVFFKSHRVVSSRTKSYFKLHPVVSSRTKSYFKSHQVVSSCIKSYFQAVQPPLHVYMHTYIHTGIHTYIHISASL